MKMRVLGAFSIAWILTVVMFAVDFATMGRFGLSIIPEWYLQSVETCLMTLLICGVLVGIGRIPRYRIVAEKLRCQDIALSILCFRTIAMYGQAVAVATYIGAAVGRPEVQDALLAWEQSFGFDWLKTYQWIVRSNILQQVLEFAYRSMAYQMVLLCFLFGILRRRQELCEMMLIFVISLLFVVAISTWYPAASAFPHFGINDSGPASHLSDYFSARSGAPMVMNPMAMQGIVSLPSFHAVVALMLIFVTRNLRFIFPVTLTLNFVMLVSTFSVGGHYLADIGAGVIVGIVTIWLVRRWFSVYETVQRPILT
ncbi:phosphatase PAP2 family protein [Burkholderia aenigmatica]|uniref:phosphatase PAP2 family protein n=1 Tax=Burkholderia aenigmatica TaxID=2015348 RepID=UPI0026561A3C|nr:phosphatase PAP2 family protein [Burkholderia aenigmatica]MDN7879001.1 phosphatase PAP2 family protein [Burkholderia aenigmatica]